MDPSLARKVGVVVFATLLIAGSGAALAQDEGARGYEVPYVPTPLPVVNRMLEIAEVEEGTYVIDLGSGDGRIPIFAAEKYGARALGVDLSPERIAESNDRAKAAGVAHKVEFKLQDLFETDIGEADVLTMYLLQSVNDKLRPRILEEMRPGARVVSHAFDMGPWEPVHSELVAGRRIYMWIVPARVDGKWVLGDGRQEFKLAIRDRTEDAPQLDVTAEANGTSLPVNGLMLHGEEISFEIKLEGETQKFKGRIDDGTLVDVESDRGGAWEARPAS
jgi:SAM-dependent methyltransferase